MADPRTSELLFREVNQHVQRAMHHPFLVVSNVNQSVSRFHFDVAWKILEMAGYSEDRAVPVLSAVLLLHQGLSIHDEIAQEADRMRQLVALAGDYDSSQYYYILAQAGHNELLRSLSRAVVKINEAKMRLETIEVSQDAETYFMLREEVEGSLLFALADTLLQVVTPWKEPLRLLVRVQIIRSELAKRVGLPQYMVSQAYETVTSALTKAASWKQHNLRPLLDYFMDYLVPVRDHLASLYIAEGNGP